MSATQKSSADAGAEAGGRRWCFAGVEFDERTGELRVNGNVVELERKSREVLRQLLYRAGEVVTKEELLDAVWADRVVTDNSLPRSMSNIRDVIGDADQTVIKTVHGYGYRLVAPVKLQASPAAPALTRLALAAGDHPPLRPLWRLVERLGAGGQGEVWLVRHDKTREQRVFKFALDLAGLAAIKREITLYRFLRETLEGRDEFTRVLDWNLEEPPYYIELEHGAGGNLEAWAEAAGGLTAVSLPARLEIVARIAEALAAAHSVGVLHKDLKPSNVLIITDGDAVPRVKLADFGSGGVLDPQRLEALGITRLGFTQSIMQGEAAATAMYLAPEVMTGQPATVQADVYALGVLLYQMVIGDLKQPLAPGWEQRVGDALLCEDIARVVAGDPVHRLADASSLAARLRTLEQRRRQREAEQAEKVRLEQEQRAARERARKAELALERLRTRRAWQRTVLAILIVAVSISLGMYLDARRARNEAAAAAASSQAVADFLSKDMFAQVSARPLRSLTIKDLLDVASATLQDRSGLTPAAAAQIHGALGGAFMSVEAFAEAEKHLEVALDLHGQAAERSSAAGVAAAAQLVSAMSILGRPAQAFTRFEAIATEAADRLGPHEPALLGLKRNLGYQRLKSGDFAGAVAAFRDVVTAARLSPKPDPVALGEAERFLAHALLLNGHFQDALAGFGEAIDHLGSLQGVAPLGLETAHVLRAQTFMELGRFDAAARDVATARRLIHDWVLDDRSPQVLAIQFLEGQMALRQARTSDAIEQLERSIRGFAATGRDQANAEPRRNLALAYRQAGRLAEAAATMRHAQDTAAGTFGPASPWAHLATAQLADIVREQGRLTEARDILMSVDRRVFERLGPDHPFTAEWRRVAGVQALAEGRVREGRAELAEAARAFELRYGPNHAFSRRASAELAAAAR